MLSGIFAESEKKIQGSIQKVAENWARDTQAVLTNDFGCNVPCVERALNRQNFDLEHINRKCKCNLPISGPKEIMTFRKRDFELMDADEYLNLVDAAGATAAAEAAAKNPAAALAGA